MTPSPSTDLISGKLRNDIRERRIFLCSADRAYRETPVEGTYTKTVEKKNPYRAVSTDRRVIADMRRLDLGFATAQYYPVRVPPIESISRLLVSMAVFQPVFDIEVGKRDIASALRLLRLRPAPPVPEDHMDTTFLIG